MTVTYTLSVAESRLSGFPRLLVKWKGSIYKLLYREMAIFCVVFYLIHVIYHHVLDSNLKSLFDKLSDYCNAYTNFIPLSFVLGFYVTMVVGRWWQQWLNIAWPDKLAMLISGIIQGSDERSKSIRLGMMRYMLTMQSLTFQAISTSIRKRFPTEADLVDGGIMTPAELEAYESIESSYGKWWVPGQWFTALAMEAYREGKIKHEIFLREILTEMHVFRGYCGNLFAYDWISIPLVYTQTVTIAVYTYFGAKLIGRQYTEKNLADPSKNLHFYVPVFTILEFFFFMGWLKVAEQLINPFGEDDDDYDCNWILDRNILVSLLIIDDMHGKHPDLDQLNPKADLLIPPTIDSQRRVSINPHMGSTMNLNVKQRRPSRLGALDGVALLTFPSEEKMPPQSNNNDDNSSQDVYSMSWHNRAMSLCIPSENLIQFQDQRRSGRKLSLEERRTSVVKSIIPPKLHTHVELSEESIEESDKNGSNEFDASDLMIGVTSGNIENIPILPDTIL